MRKFKIIKKLFMREINAGCSRKRSNAHMVVIKP